MTTTQPTNDDSHATTSRRTSSSRSTDATLPKTSSTAAPEVADLTSATARADVRAWLTLLATCLGAMMTFLQITASGSALSAIQQDLHVSPSGLIWIPSAYTLLVACLVLSSGTLGNIYGRKRLFLTGTVVMAAGSLTVFFAGATGVVITGQLVSGLGGALILPNSLAILGSAFPDPHRRTEMITAWAASSGVGLAIGPVIAGILLNRFSWHSVFLSTVVLAVITFAVAGAYVEESRQGGGHLDALGQSLAVLGVAAIVYALIDGGQDGYGSGRIVVAWVVGGVALLAFIAVERGSRRPMLDLQLFRSRSFSSVMFIAAVSLFGFTGVAILSVLYYEQVQRLSALQMGYRLIALFGVYVVVAYATGRAIRRTGFKLPLTAGLLLGAGATFGLTSQGPATPYTHVWWLYALFGAACGLVAAPSTAAALVSVSTERSGMASGSVNAFRQVGSVLGSSLLGTVLVTRLHNTLPDQLAAHHVPAGARAAVEAAVASGRTDTAAPAAVTAAVDQAFVTGLHAAMTVTGVVFAVAAVIAALAVHNRPHHAVAASR